MMVRYLTNKGGKLVTFRFCLTGNSSPFQLKVQPYFYITLGLKRIWFNSIL